MLRIAAALTLFASLVHSTAAEAAKPRFIDVDLIAETARPMPGGSTLVGLRMIPKPGWHSYWINPGEAGFPTVVEWKAPSGVRFGPLRHPAPSLIQVAGMASYVHEGPHVLVAQMSLDPDIPAGTAIPVTAEVNWAACSEKLCVPEKATLSLQLVTGDGTKSEAAPLLRRALTREPKRMNGGGFDIEGGNLLLELPAKAHLNATKARFFPDENGIADVSKTRIVSTSPIRISIPASGGAPKVLAGVVSDGSSAYRLRLDRKALAPREPSDPPNLERRKEVTAKPAIDRLDAIETTAAASPTPPPSSEKMGQSNQRYLAIAGAAVLAVLAIAIMLFRQSRAKRA